jgi:prepilin-type N-terminal cleavage/methylation domain
MLLKLRQKTKGFTLIELMIVVVIIGILAALAIPNFLRYQAKSKQSEAKTNLGAIYVSETAYFGENDTYAELDSLEWAPEGKTRYTYDASPSATSFTAGADGNIDNETTVTDHWTIDDQKILSNTVNDVIT